MDRHPPSADQHVLAAFIADGYLDRHIRKMRGVYAEKRRVLIEAINTHIPAELAVVQPCDQGMHMVLWLRKDPMTCGSPNAPTKPDWRCGRCRRCMRPATVSRVWCWDWAVTPTARCNRRWNGSDR